MYTKDTHTQHTTSESFDIYLRTLPKIHKTVQQIFAKALPVTSCCPVNPTGTIPRLFIAVAQADGSVTDMLNCVVSIAMFPKPSAADGKEAHSDQQDC